MKNILVFINPHSRRGKALRRHILKYLEENQIKILNENIYCLPEEINRTLVELKDSAEGALICGGDGTLRETLPGLLQSRIPLLYLPIGTLNNFAKTLSLPMNVDRALSLILNPHIKEIELGVANGILFHTVVGLGLSTQANRFVRTNLKKWFGAFAFIWAGLKTVYRMKPFSVVIIVDGKVHKGKSWQITVCNGKYYGSGLKIDQDANMTDHLLRGQSVETLKWWHALKFLPHLLFRRSQRQYEDLEIFEGREVWVKTHRPMRVDLDGDAKSKTPLKLTIHPQKLKILIP